MDQPAAHDTTSTLTHLSSLLEEEYHSHIATLGLLMQAQESADVWKRTAEYLSHRLDIAKSEVLWLQAQLENYRTEVRRLNLIITNSVQDKSCPEWEQFSEERCNLESRGGSLGEVGEVLYDGPSELE